MQTILQFYLSFLGMGLLYDVGEDIRYEDGCHGECGYCTCWHQNEQTTVMRLVIY